MINSSPLLIGRVLSYSSKVQSILKKLIYINRVKHKVKVLKRVMLYLADSIENKLLYKLRHCFFSEYWVI